MPLDCLVADGQLLTPDGTQTASIGIREGRIAAIGDASALPDARTVIDAAGCWVLPGIIDSHVHFREPGFTHKEDFETGTRAAARGGVTLAMDMPNCDPLTNTVEAFEDKRAVAERKAVVDFNHNPSGYHPEAIAGFAEAGALAVKQFMIEDTERGYPHMPGLGTRDRRHLLEIALATREAGIPLMVHPHSQQIAEYAQERIWDEHGRDYEAYLEWYSAMDWLPVLEAVSSLIQISASTGAHVHVCHAKWARGFELVRQARSRGEASVTLEVNAASLLITPEDITDGLGPFGMGSGAGVNDEDRAATWEAVRDGTVDVIATDHAPHTRAEKEPGWEDMWQAANGSPQLEFYVPLLVDAVHRGQLSAERLVELCSTNPAKLFGVYPRKGSLQVGADADLAIVDPEREWTISIDDVESKCGWTPFDGRSLQGDVIRTIVRGETVMADGEVTAEPGYGAFTPPTARARAPGR